MPGIYLDENVPQPLAHTLRPAGHDVLTTREAGRRRAGDEEQLVFAAQLGRILITLDGKHFRLLQRAWRHWADEWNVQPRPIHAGILAVPQPSPSTIVRLTHEIDAFIRSGPPLANRFFEWTLANGWTPYG